MVVTVSADELVAKYIESDPRRPGLGEARLVEFGVPVWAIIGHMRATGADPAETAESYEIPIEAVEAALAYYGQHRAAIETRLEANRAALVA